jgi:hypothetical protein
MVDGMAKKRAEKAAPETSGVQAPVVRIFLSSPGDVADERKICPRADRAGVAEAPLL